jgi:predicted Rdx family selenoprotein
VKKGPVGIFDVYVDESVIYSNRKEGGRLPKNDEVIQRIRDYQGRSALPTKGDQSTDKKAQREVKKPQATTGSQCGCG